MNQSEIKAAKLKELFDEVELPEIPGVDFRTLTPEQITQMLPAYGGEHPVKAILVDRQTGKGYGIASGWEVDKVAHQGIMFRSGAVTDEMAKLAGITWERLANHVEVVAAAFMRRLGIVSAILCINGRNPCWGDLKRPGCYYSLPEFLAEEARLSVYNKYGADFVKSWPDRKFHFTGLPD